MGWMVIGRALLLWMAGMGVAHAADPPALLPTPQRMTVGEGGFRLGPATSVTARTPAERAAAARLSELLASAGLGTGRGPGPAVRFVQRAGLPAEGYRLVTDTRGATITASDQAGLFYGAVTLWQLATQPGAKGQVPAVTIEDAPRFRWRGLMLDSARHYQSPEYIRRLIDWMAAHKLNRLHWHLVDDQGWRLPVPGYPKLTRVSAWRRGATAPGAPPLPVEGGFYTPDQIQALVAHAAARGITIVPEIEMPGHALAAIRAYPELGTGVPIPPGTESDYGVFPWLYNTEEPTFRFLEAVLTEAMRLFPSKDIHVGGDEAVKHQWRASPAIQAQIKALGLKDEEALQGWFMARIGRFLKANGRRLVGWDEILDGGVPADAAITSWRGIEGAVKAAKSGHDAILSPAPTLYLNNLQGRGAAEPPSHGAPVPLSTVLAFDPLPKALSAAEHRHILGLQANLWTEHVRTEARAAWMTFPRGAAVAEIGWAATPTRAVASFARQWVPQADRLAPLGLAPADSAWAVETKLERAGEGTTTATLANQAALPIRYTLDGSAPGAASRLYSAPLSIRSGQRLRAATFLDARALPGGYDRRIDTAAALSRTSRELTQCTAKVPLELEDDFPTTGPRAVFSMDIFNPCWRWDAAPVGAARQIAIHVGQLPFNFQVGADRQHIRFRPPATPAGEMEVRRDGCEGRVVATLPLAPAATNPGVTRLTAALPRGGTTDLCFTYTARGVDPLWAIERIELIP
jgi:hexosaminidase